MFTIKLEVLKFRMAEGVEYLSRELSRAGFSHKWHNHIS